jgi:hypothetical protein|tara:strand:+ start:444 stop:683 length:240 start_codon:yes stop_codon:yes gene_type:complete
MDGRKNNGGHKTAGRKPKAEEIELIERLSPLDDLAFAELKKGIERGSFPHLKLFHDYRYGKPRETKDINISEELPLFVD